MTYLFLGEDTASKDLKIGELKNKFLPSADALKFDYEVLYAQKLEPQALKQALISLPILAKERLVVIRECHKLSPPNKDLILAYLRNPGCCELVLDSDKWDADDSFVRKLGRAVKVTSFKKEAPLNVFNLTRAIAFKKTGEALKILSALLFHGEQPLQIMGGLVWYWKDARRKLSLEQFKKGLLALQEADLNIKRSRLKPEHALEILVVKLCAQEVC